MVIYIQSVTIFGFGNTYIDCVKILNNDFKAAVLQCGFRSEQFKIQTECRQGEPIAPY